MSYVCIYLIGILYFIFFFLFHFSRYCIINPYRYLYIMVKSNTNVLRLKKYGVHYKLYFKTKNKKWSFFLIVFYFCKSIFKNHRIYDISKHAWPKLALKHLILNTQYIIYHYLWILTYYLIFPFFLTLPMYLSTIVTFSLVVPVIFSYLCLNSNFNLNVYVLKIKRSRQTHIKTSVEFYV